MNFVTEVCAVDPIHPDHEAIKRAAEWIKRGEVIGFPTETVYGLGADATNSSAVKRIYQVKNRPADNPLIVHFSSLDEFTPYIHDIPQLARNLADQFWPGPLTLVLQRGADISPLVTQGLDTLAIRIPAHPVALALIETSGVPIAAPSANLSGRPSPTRAAHVFNDLNGQIPLILDGGSTSVGIESTVVNLTSDQPILLRPGGITIEELRQFIPDLLVPEPSKPVAQPLSPGMKYTHYSPETELALLSGATKLSDLQIDEIAVNQNKRTLILCTNGSHTHRHDHLNVGGNPREIQVNFFASLRLLDEGQYQLGIFEDVEDNKEGYTVMNRVRKAAHRTIENEVSTGKSKTRDE